MHLDMSISVYFIHSKKKKKKKKGCAEREDLRDFMGPRDYENLVRSARA